MSGRKLLSSLVSVLSPRVYKRMKERISRKRKISLGGKLKREIRLKIKVTFEGLR